MYAAEHVVVCAGEVILHWSSEFMNSVQRKEIGHLTFRSMNGIFPEFYKKKKKTPPKRLKPKKRGARIVLSNEL